MEAEASGDSREEEGESRCDMQAIESERNSRARMSFLCGRCFYIVTVCGLGMGFHFVCFVCLCLAWMFLVLACEERRI